MNGSSSQHSALSPLRPLSETSAQHSPPQHLGLLGGSFNPIHNCHLSIAHHIHERLRLSRILFIPSGDPPHKRDGSLAPAADRLEMVRLATAGIPFFDVSDIELQRPGKSYSIDTVRALQTEYGPSVELFFIIGLDAFLDFPTWRAPRELLQICHFVVVPRPGQSFRTLTDMSLLPRLDPDALIGLDDGTVDALTIAIPSSQDITCLVLPPCTTSASEIRRRIRHRESLVNMLPPSVESYIIQHTLYEENGHRTHI
jgi:nicotinate-nucleotide adenylyltransferase